MKKILFIAIIAAFMGCAEKDPPPTLDEQLQGVWERNWVSITNRYNFHDGACDVYSIIPAHPVQYYAYAYTTDGDILNMMDLASGEVYSAVVSFPTDSTAVLAWVGGVNYFLKRK